MNKFTPENLSPREDTLHFLHLFARLYQPGTPAREAKQSVLSLFARAEPAVC